MAEERPKPNSRQSKSGGERRGARGGEGREVQISKVLSKLLRHQAENAGIKLDNEGFAPLDRVLQWGPLRSLNVSLDELKSVVANNSKSRFTLKTTSEEAAEDSPSLKDYLIRANQGHSVQVDASALFQPIALDDADFPAKVVHGTYFAFWDAIVASGGLKAMGRHHIHCSDKTPEEGAVSGMRKDAEIMVEIDIAQSMKEGVPWWRSQNGVILTDGGEAGVLSTKFFKMVNGRAQGVGVLWEDGEKKADLPPGIKIRVPMGKRAVKS